MSGPKCIRVKQPARYAQTGRARLVQLRETLSREQREELEKRPVAVGYDLAKLLGSVAKVEDARENSAPEIPPSVLNKPAIDSFELVWNKFVESAGKRFSITTLEAHRQQFLELSKISRDRNSVNSAASDIERSMAKHLEKIKAVAVGLVEAGVVAKTLINEKVVSSFHATASRQWHDRHELLAKTNGEPEMTPEIVLEGITSLVKDAQTIFEEAIGREQNSEARLDLLKATITSLKSLGFFVNDPQYEDPQNPLASVVLTATRGAEKVYVSVPLVGEVHSRWDGIPDEPCIDSFLEYLDQLKEHGFECEPTRQDLQNRPRLLKKGEKALPRNGTEGKSV